MYVVNKRERRKKKNQRKISRLDIHTSFHVIDNTRYIHQSKPTPLKSQIHTRPGFCRVEHYLVPVPTVSFQRPIWLVLGLDINNGCGCSPISKSGQKWANKQM